MVSLNTEHRSGLSAQRAMLSVQCRSVYSCIGRATDGAPPSSRSRAPARSGRGGGSVSPRGPRRTSVRGARERAGGAGRRGGTAYRGGRSGRGIARTGRPSDRGRGPGSLGAASRGWHRPICGVQCERGALWVWAGDVPGAIRAGVLGWIEDGVYRARLWSGAVALPDCGVAVEIDLDSAGMGGLGISSCVGIGACWNARV